MVHPLGMYKFQLFVRRGHEQDAWNKKEIRLKIIRNTITDNHLFTQHKQATARKRFVKKAAQGSKKQQRNTYKWW